MNHETTFYTIQCVDLDIKGRRWTCLRGGPGFAATAEYFCLLHRADEWSNNKVIGYQDET